MGLAIIAQEAQPCAVRTPVEIRRGPCAPYGDDVGEGQLPPASGPGRIRQERKHLEQDETQDGPQTPSPLSQVAILPGRGLGSRSTGATLKRPGRLVPQAASSLPAPRVGSRHSLLPAQSCVSSSPIFSGSVSPIFSDSVSPSWRWDKSVTYSVTASCK